MRTAPKNAGDLLVRQMLQDLPDQSSASRRRRIPGQVQAVEGDSFAGLCCPEVVDEFRNAIDADVLIDECRHPSADAEVAATQVGYASDPVLPEEALDCGDVGKGDFIRRSGA